MLIKQIYKKKKIVLENHDVKLPKHHVHTRSSNLYTYLLESNWSIIVFLREMATDRE